eukprot:245686_1
MLKNDIEEEELTDNINEFGIHSDNIKLSFKKLLMIVQNKINIILIGDENIGKKRLIKRYICNKFDDEEKYETKQQWNKQQTLSGKETMNLNIQIISNINELNNNNKLIDVIMVCYDISNEETFINCCKLSNNILKYKNEINNKLITILVGLKSDIQNIDRKIEDKNAEKRKNMNEWKSLNIDDCQCSAKTGKNIKSLFLSAAEMIYTQRKEKEISSLRLICKTNITSLLTTNLNAYISFEEWKNQHKSSAVKKKQDKLEPVSKKADDKLLLILQKNNLYNDLYDVLVSNKIDLDMLKNDIEEEELTDNINEFGIHSDNIKLSFKKLLMIVQNKINIILIGDENIGKKRLIKRYICNKFDDEEKYETKQQWNKQ